jgi:hypothetical protein
MENTVTTVLVVVFLMAMPVEFGDFDSPRAFVKVRVRRVQGEELAALLAAGKPLPEDACRGEEKPPRRVHKRGRVD